MPAVQCDAFMGGMKSVPVEKLSFRPSVYGVIRDGERVLLVRTRNTNKYALPGGGVELGETLEDALRREVREETGIEIDAMQFQAFRQQFFYYDPTDEAFHSFLFFYRCTPATLQVCEDGQVEDGEVEKPRWVRVGDLREQDFHSFGDVTLGILRAAEA
jgi:8-oxo-dGTP pyrophosphatase MutT (NUDIX family)